DKIEDEPNKRRNSGFHVKEDEWYGSEHVNGVIISAIVIEQEADMEINKEPDHESRIEEDNIKDEKKMMLISVKDVRKTNRNFDDEVKCMGPETSNSNLPIKIMDENVTKANN
ncbi:6593_t:CDS:2, partial [Ambispora gerdemannii]